MVFANATNVTSLTELVAYNQSVTYDLFSPLLVLAVFVVAFSVSGFETPRRFAFASFASFIFASLLSFGVGVLDQTYSFITLFITIIAVAFLYFEGSRKK